MIKQCNKRFHTMEQVKDYMCMNTGLLSREYKAQWVGAGMLPENIVITFANPIQAKDTLEQMIEDGYWVNDSCDFTNVTPVDGPIAITCL